MKRDAYVRALELARDIRNARAIEDASAIIMERVFACVPKSCEHCGTKYWTGPETGRRSHNKFCSDRCRVYASRKRRAERALSFKA